MPGQAVVWYFISDSMRLRHAMRARYGAKVLTSVDNVDVRHIYALHGGSSACVDLCLFFLRRRLPADPHASMSRELVLHPWLKPMWVVAVAEAASGSFGVNRVSVDM